MLTTLFLLVACQSDEGKKAPTGQIKADGKKYELKYLNYEWMEDNLVIRQPNSETIYESLKADQAIPVKKGDELLLQIEKNPDSVTVAAPLFLGSLFWSYKRMLFAFLILAPYNR